MLLDRSYESCYTDYKYHPYSYDKGEYPLKQWLYIVWILLIVLGGTPMLASCQKQPEAFSTESAETARTEADTVIPGKAITVSGADYTDYVPDSLEAWLDENRENGKNGANTRPGIIVSPYYTLTINGTDIPVFTEKTTRSPHSFAYIDVANATDASSFSLDVVLTTHTTRKYPVVLPESAGVTATSDGTNVRAVITDYGTYTFTFDRRNGTGGSSYPLTLMVKPAETSVAPDTYNRVDFTPGTYPSDKTNLSQPNTLYYFKKGTYDIECISIAADNITVYFEPGTLLRARFLTYNDNGSPVYGSVFSSWGHKNVRILGRPALDVAMRERADVIFSFTRMEDMEFAGFNVCNSNSWTCCFTNCKDLVVRDLILLGYRTFSDGVMLSDCENATVSGCFVRTGDDALEVKSTSDGTLRTKNVLFTNNAVWTDKGIAYGCVYESNFDQSAVTWRNNSVGFALADWSAHLGCATVSINGSDPTVTDYDMGFENLEIYVTHCPLITVYMENGGTVRDIRFKNIHAKEAKLNTAVSNNYIDLIIKNADEGPLSDFTLGDLWFEDISWNDNTLTPENAATEIRFSVPSDYPIDEGILHIQ